MTVTPREIFDRIPPCDIDTERALICALIEDPTAFDRIGVVDGSDFYDVDFGRLFGALQTLRDAHQPIGDVLTLLPALRRMGLPEHVTQTTFFIRLIGQGFPWNANYYADRIRQLAILRRMLDTASELMQRVHGDKADPIAISNWLEARREALTAGQGTPARSFKDVSIDVLTELETPSDDRRGVMTGINAIDNVIGAFLPGEITILAARPGVGKTAMAGQIGVYSAERERSVLFASLEMTDRELVQRILCAEAGVNGMHIRTRRIDADDRRLLVDAAGQLANLPLWLWSPAGATLSRLRGVAKLHHAARELRLLIVDYVGLVQPDNSRLPRFEHIAAVSGGLKLLAKELSIPVLALCQLNREADSDAPPRLSQLRDSGAIEQDADAVIFLHRPKGGAETECIVAKNRHGVTGKFHLLFDAERTRFE